MESKIFEGSRVYLRPFQKEDYPNIYQALLNREIRKMTGSQRLLTLESITKAYDNFATDNSRMDLVIVLNETNTVIGDLALNQIDFLNRNASVRIALYDQQYFGKGLGTEALSLVLEYAFDVLSLHRVGLNVYEYNQRGIRAYEKLGFVKEGVFRQELLYEGKYYDNIIMGVLRDEFKNLSRASHTNDAFY